MNPKDKAVLPNGDIVDVIEIPRHLHVLCSTDDEGAQCLHAEKGETVRLHMADVSDKQDVCAGCWFESESHGCTATRAFLAKHSCDTFLDSERGDAVSWFIFQEVPARTA